MPPRAALTVGPTARKQAAGMQWPISSSRPPHRSTLRPRSARSGTAWGTARFILTLAILAWGLRSFVAAPFSIPSGSMHARRCTSATICSSPNGPTATPATASRSQFPPFSGRILEQLPKRGDVVVFRHPIEECDLIKRVIGLPATRSRLRGGELILNGRPVPREPIAPYRSADQRQHAVQGRSACYAVRSARATDTSLLRVSRLSRDAAGRPGYTVLDQADVSRGRLSRPVRCQRATSS